MNTSLKDLRKKLKSPGGLKNHLSRMKEKTLYTIIMFFKQQNIKDSAGKALLKRKNVGIDSLIYAAKNCSNKLKEDIWERLLKEDLSETNLHYIIREIPYLKERAKEKLSKEHPEKKKIKY